MKLIKRLDNDLVILQPDSFEDYRGENLMAYSKKDYIGCHHEEFVEQNFWSGYKGTLVGIHHSPNCWKLYECVYGRAYYAFIKMTEPDYGKWWAVTLTDKNHYQVIKPPDYASSLLILSDYAVIHVMQSQYYNPDKPDQISYRYNDRKFNVKYPLKEFVLSQRDSEVLEIEDIGISCNGIRNTR